MQTNANCASDSWVSSLFDIKLSSFAVPIIIISVINKYIILTILRGNNLKWWSNEASRKRKSAENTTAEKWPHPVRLETKMYFHVSLGFHDKTYKVDCRLFFRIFLPPIFWAQLDHLSHMPEGFWSKMTISCQETPTKALRGIYWLLVKIAI